MDPRANSFFPRQHITTPGIRPSGRNESIQNAQGDSKIARFDNDMTLANRLQNLIQTLRMENETIAHRVSFATFLEDIQIERTLSSFEAARRFEESVNSSEFDV